MYSLIGFTPESVPGLSMLLRSKGQSELGLRSVQMHVLAESPSHQTPASRK